HNPRSASRVLPAAIPTLVGTDTSVVTLAKSAPRKIPGQSQRPQRRSNANAMPLAGQTAEALGCTNASDKPNLPAQKKTAVVAKMAPAVFKRCFISSGLPRSPHAREMYKITSEPHLYEISNLLAITLWSYRSRVAGFGIKL